MIYLILHSSVALVVLRLSKSFKITPLVKAEVVDELLNIFIFLTFFVWPSIGHCSFVFFFAKLWSLFLCWLKNACFRSSFGYNLCPFLFKAVLVCQVRMFGLNDREFIYLKYLLSKLLGLWMLAFQEGNFLLINAEFCLLEKSYYCHVNIRGSWQYEERI